MRIYYQDIITEKSWQILKELKKDSDFVLIGGWAVYLYSKAFKSKDIDIIVDFKELENLSRKFNIYKNNRLKKYEIKKEGIDVDIYVPYFSELGVGAEEIIKYTNKIEAFKLPQKEILLITKQQAYQDRKESKKGEKDMIDIFSLILLKDFDFKLYLKLLKKFRLEKFKSDLTDLLENTIEISELGLNRHFFARRKREIFRKLGRLSQDDF